MNATKAKVLIIAQVTTIGPPLTALRHGRIFVPPGVKTTNMLGSDDHSSNSRCRIRIGKSR
jgi:hypothetical protein